MSDPDEDGSSESDDKVPVAATAAAYKQSTVPALTAEQRKRLLNGARPAIVSERKKAPAAAALGSGSKRKQPSQSPPAARSTASTNASRAAAAAVAGSARQAGVRPAAPKRARRQASEDERPQQRRPAAAAAAVASAAPRSVLTGAARAAALTAAAFGDDNDNDENDAFQNVEVKRYVPICSTPRDVYTEEDEKAERQFVGTCLEPPADWCPLCPINNTPWAAELNAMVSSYPDFPNSVIWAKPVQEAYEEKVLRPHIDEVVKNETEDPATGEIVRIDPDFKQSLFHWPLRSILHHFRSHREHPVVQLADQRFKDRQLCELHANGGVVYKMVDMSNDGVLPAPDSDKPPQIDPKGQSAYFAALRQLDKTSAELRAVLKELKPT